MSLSQEAVDELTRIIEKTGLKISEQAGGLAKHAKRKTIKSRDIKLAHIK